MPDRVATIIIGNPLIADLLQSGGLLVVTGRAMAPLIFWHSTARAASSWTRACR
jgi:hypothetical protein